MILKLIYLVVIFLYLMNRCDDINIYLNHGDLYSYDKREKFYDKGVLVYGHYYIPYIRKDKDMFYICVGSISLSRGASDYSYMIYENHKFTLYNIDGIELNFIELYFNY